LKYFIEKHGFSATVLNLIRSECVRGMAMRNHFQDSEPFSACKFCCNWDRRVVRVQEAANFLACWKNSHHGISDVSRALGEA
jgi:hypothetical protein